VGPEQRRRRVQDLHARVGEPFENREPFFGSSQVLAHIEARERDVAGPQRQQGLSRGDQLDRPAVPGARRQRDVRLARSVGDDGDAHGGTRTLNPRSPPVGISLVTDR